MSTVADGDNVLLTAVIKGAAAKPADDVKEKDKK
jgi:hypothetical protein